MTQPSVLILRAAGTNCERETAFAFEHFGAASTTLHVNALLADSEQLLSHHILAIPGGFSYGDDVGAGAVFACELGTRLADPLQRFIQNGGLVLGICNGFQVLVRLGLLPGIAQTLGKQEVSLTDNVSHKYEDRWVRCAVQSRRCVFIGDMEAPDLPLAHAEGRFVCLDDELHQRLYDEDRVVLRYADAQGEPTLQYPHNPNGSVDGIAALTDATGQVLGIMPHPERAFFSFHHPEWTRAAQEGPLPDLGPGAPFFENACRWVTANR